MTDLNLAGLATIAFLILFFPSVGLFERRRRAALDRRADQRHKQALDRLLLEQATNLLTEAEQPKARR